jgi:signal peptidase
MSVGPDDDGEDSGPGGNGDGTGRGDGSLGETGRGGSESAAGGQNHEQDIENPSGAREWLRWLATTDRGVVAFLREVLGSVAAVALVGLILFAVSGLWPPMVAVESPSMEPNMKSGDLVFVMDQERFAPDAAHDDAGVVTARAGERVGYRTFDGPGDVIVYTANGDGGTTPIIHRTMFWVNESENWYEKADREFVGRADSCRQLRSCPAPHDGFITKGDNNGRYDQVGNVISKPVRPEWVIGTAEFRIPKVGCIRLLFSGQVPDGCRL